MYIIYSKSNCKYCDMAKDILPCRYIEYLNPPTDVVQRLKEETGQNTYPFIFDSDGFFVGGYSELKDSLDF